MILTRDVKRARRIGGRVHRAAAHRRERRINRVRVRLGLEPRRIRWTGWDVV